MTWEDELDDMLYLGLDEKDWDEFRPIGERYIRIFGGEPSRRDIDILRAGFFFGCGASALRERKWEEAKDELFLVILSIDPAHPYNNRHRPA